MTPYMRLADNIVAGKGTQCERLVKDYGFKHLSGEHMTLAGPRGGMETDQLVCRSRRPPPSRANAPRLDLRRDDQRVHQGRPNRAFGSHRQSLSPYLALEPSHLLVLMGLAFGERDACRLQIPSHRTSRSMGRWQGSIPDRRLPEEDGSGTQVRRGGPSYSLLAISRIPRTDEFE